MPEVVFPLDYTKKFTDQQHVGHNRWHPDIPRAGAPSSRATSSGCDCREWFDGAIDNDDSADDVLNAPLPGRARAHRAVPRSRAPSPATC